MDDDDPFSAKYDRHHTTDEFTWPQITVIIVVLVLLAYRFFM
jgi:hypothetical protein